MCKCSSPKSLKAVRCCTACVQKHHALRISNRIYTLTDAFHTVTIGNTFLNSDAQGLENARILHTNLACAMARIHKVAKQTWEQEACCRLVRRSATNTPSLVVQTPKSRYVVYECLVVIALPSVAKTFRLDLSAPIALQTLRLSGPALIQQLLRHHLNLTERTALFAFLCTPVDWSKPPSRKRKNVFKLDFECKHSYSPSMKLVACSAARNANRATHTPLRWPIYDNPLPSRARPSGLFHETARVRRGLDWRRKVHAP